MGGGPRWAVSVGVVVEEGAGPDESPSEGEDEGRGLDEEGRLDSPSRGGEEEEAGLAVDVEEAAEAAVDEVDVARRPDSVASGSFGEASFRRQSRAPAARPARNASSQRSAAKPRSAQLHPAPAVPTTAASSSATTRSHASAHCRACRPSTLNGSIVVGSFLCFQTLCSFLSPRRLLLGV